MPTLGMHEALATYNSAATAVKADMWLFLTEDDKTNARLASKREFPFDTSGTTGELYFKAYGSGLKSDATLTVSIPASATFVTVQSYRDASVTTFTFALDASYVTKTAVTGSASGLVEFTFTAGTWGGDCCETSNDCAVCNGAAAGTT